MSVIESFGSEYNRLRLLGFSRLESTVLICFDPVRFSLLIMWHVCILLSRVCVLRPIFMVGMLTVGSWAFLPATQLSEVANILILNTTLMTALGKWLLLSSAVVEGMWLFWLWRSGRLPSLKCRISGREGNGHMERKDKQR